MVTTRVVQLGGILVMRDQIISFTEKRDLGAVHMSRASPANRADSILSRPMVA